LNYTILKSETTISEYLELTPYDFTKNISIAHNISLEVNRFSGVIPSVFYAATRVDILNGNMFSCNLQRSDLPHQDPSYATYQCGSEYTNISFSIWAIRFVIVFIILAIIQCYYRRTKTIVKVVWSYIQRNSFSAIFENNDHNHHENTPQTSLIETFPHIYRLVFVHQYLIRLLLVALFYFSLVLLPIYIALTVKYGTFTHQYIWIVSSAFLSGVHTSHDLIDILSIDDYEFVSFIGISTTSSS
jgi:uncharacterized membrane protein